jgi:hypothetical protein
LKLSPVSVTISPPLASYAFVEYKIQTRKEAYVKKTLLTFFALAAASCWGQALHGCIVGTSCFDNGTVTPTTVNSPAFTFTVGGGGTGDLLIDILVPDNLSGATTESFTINGTLAGPTDTSSISGTAVLKGDWTSGGLAGFLGISASPTDTLSNWLNYTKGNNCGAAQNSACDSGANGYDVYQVNLGNNELQKPGTGVEPVLTISGNALPMASVITAFLGNDSTYQATSGSGGIFEADAPVATTPEPASLFLLGTVGIGLSCLLRRRARRNF